MRAVLIALAVVLCACGGGGPTLPVQVAPPSTPAIWPLRGTTAPDGDAIHKRPLVIKVANDPAARPQSGLAQAAVVLEIPVEGGVPRDAPLVPPQAPAK